MLVDQCLSEAVICLASCAALGWQMGRISLPAIWTAWHGRDAVVA